MIDALCTAVRDQLNAETFSPVFMVVIDDAPEFDIEDLNTLKVTMMPFGADFDPVTRSHDRQRFVIDIAFQRHAPARPASGADPIVAMSLEIRNLQQTVANWLSVRTRRIPPTYQTAKLMKIDQMPLYDAGLLRKERVYVGVMRLTYEAIERL